jgi:hypothetical protein
LIVERKNGGRSPRRDQGENSFTMPPVEHGEIDYLDYSKQSQGDFNERPAAF